MEVNSAARRTGTKNRAICSFWLRGRCNRNPCRFLHVEKSTPQSFDLFVPKQSLSLTRKDRQSNPKIVSIPADEVCGAKNFTAATSLPFSKRVRGPANESNATTQKPRVWKNCADPGINCVHGEECMQTHAWFCGDELSTVANLQGHINGVTGIALPAKSETLYSGCEDGTVMIWDCNTGQCAETINVGGEVGSLISEGPWVFVGLRNLIKVWNIETAAEFSLSGPCGLVSAMVVIDDMFFAGGQDGTISVWRGSNEANPFQMVASLREHTKAVVCLVVGRKRLYSSSMDHTIRVWDIDTLQCTMTLTGHTDVVTSMICWAYYLLSSSLDCTLKIWGETETGDLEVIYTHKEEHGVIGLWGMTVEDCKHILFCSCNDGSVHLYELPSFADRGRVFSEQLIRALWIGPGGQFMTGDGSGDLMVWKWLPEQKVVSAER